MTPEQITPINKMDLDSDLTVVGRGYCRLARNVIRTRGVAGKGYAMRLTLGNKKAFNIGSVVSQRKQYRIYCPANTVMTFTLRMLSATGAVENLSWTITNANGPADVAAQTLAFWAGSGQSVAATPSGNFANGGYVTFTYTHLAFGNIDYLLTADPVTAGGQTFEYDVVCSQELIPTNLEGKLIPIASADLGGNALYIISTTQRNTPTAIGQTVVGVTLNGPTTVITLSSAHEMTVGEQVNIKYSNSVWLNGTFTITAITAFTITIATAQVFTGSAIPAFTVGSEAIYRHPYGIGEVGVATYDDNDNVWQYRRLIRSTEFNLNTLKTLDRPTVEKNNYRVSLYWTDGYNQPKALYIVGDTPSTDMCLGTVNSDGLYWYGYIAEATQHILPQARATIDLVEQKQDGGNITAGMKRYAARLLNRYLVATDWGTPTAQIPVYGPPTSLDNNGNRVIGSEGGDPTGKINKLRLDGANRFIYDFVEIAVVDYAGGLAPSAQVIMRIPTRTGPIGTVRQRQILFQHDGYETTYDLALSELIDLSSDIFDTAKNAAVLDNRMIFSNLNRDEEDDLTAWAQTFRHRVMVREIQESRDNALTKTDDTDPAETPFPRPQVGEYQLVENVFRYIGYMDNDTYRYGVMLRERKTGRWTRVFHVDDISVDPYDTNINGNPNDPTRRATDNQGVGIWLPNPGGAGFTQYFTRRKRNWALTAAMDSTDTTTGVISAYTTMCKPMASYVEFFGADMTATVGGVPIRDKYDRIRFVRPDTIAKVLTTGYGVLGVCHAGMSQIMSSDLDHENSALVGPASIISLNPIKSKIAIYNQEGRAINEWPYFCGGMPVPEGPFYSPQMLAPTSLTGPIPSPPGSPLLRDFMEWAYPLNASVGEGFGYTRMRGDGTWDEHAVGDPASIVGTANDWNFPNNRTPFVAFPNMISFYSADHLFGGMDPNVVKEGRYRLRVMAVSQEAVRTKVDAPTGWGRAYNMMCEWHNRPSNTDVTNFGGQTFPILRANSVAHGSYCDVDNFRYDLTNYNPFPSLPLPTSSWPTAPNLSISQQYHRSLAGFNLLVSFPNFPNEAVDNGGASPHNPQTDYWQKITKGLWHNSPCIFIQLGDEDGDYPKFTTAYAHYGSIVGSANCAAFPPCPTDVLKSSGSGSTQTSTSDPWNGASLANYQAKRTNPLDDEEGNPAGTGTFYGQLVRDIDDPYGDKEQTIYRWICAEFAINPSDAVIPQNTYSIFGGDTFTQGTYVKNRYVNEATRTLTDYNWDLAFRNSYNNEGIGSAARPGFGSGFKMFSQNRLNSQLRFTTPEQLIYLGDTVDRQYWLDYTDAKKDTFTYSDAYTPLFNIQQFSPFIGSLPTRYQSPTRIQWSSRAVVDGLGDQYRDVKPLSFKDLDLSKGEIEASMGVNGELVTWQRDSFDRQFFNARGQLVATTELNIVIGESDVMTRDGINISIYGCQHRESIIRGRSDGGKDVMLWFNANTNQFIRFGADGTVVISERQPIASWLRENAKWVRNEHSPHDTFGIRGVWDERFREAIWTFTGQKTCPSWQLAVNYPQGYAISYGSSGFNGFGDIYISKRNQTSSSSTEIGVGPDWQDFWELVPHTDPQYYTEFTISWSEIANGFVTMYGPMPSIYMKWRDAFLTPNPQSKDSVYVHRVGESGVWWNEDDGVGLIEDGYQELVYNNMPSEVKKYYAIQVSSDDAPDRIEFETPSQESYLDDDEFEFFEGMWRSPIKYDSTASGVNDGDGNRLFGRTMLTRLKIFARSENTIRDTVIKVQVDPRSVTK